MAGIQSQNGKAFEYACINALETLISHYRKVSILGNSSYKVAKVYWDQIHDDLKIKMKAAATVAAENLAKMEPLLLDTSDDMLVLSLQADATGEGGDVRDVLIVRSKIGWEIGVSVKHNHKAVKHPRLSKNLDFGSKWFGLPCSAQYFNEIGPIFDQLKIYKDQGMKWSEVKDKWTTIYKPLIKSFRDELTRLDSANPTQVPAKLLEYLLGRNDFYKVISLDSKKEVIILGYNVHGTLNKPSQTKSPDFKVSKYTPPSRIYRLENITDSSETTLELILDKGWNITFRFHSASTLVEPSIKLDVQMQGDPQDIFSHHVSWQ